MAMTSTRMIPPPALSRVATLGLALLAAACGDSQPPSWPAGAALESATIEDDSVELRWPRAQDDGAIESYAILRDGEQVAEVSGTVFSFRLGDLGPNTEYRFGVRAEDESGNESPPIELSVRTADRAVPTWPAGAVVTITEGPGHPEVPPCNKPEVAANLLEMVKLTFSWPAAQDDTGVTAYRIKQGASVIARVGGDALRYEMITAAPNGDYLVEAGDAAGNWSAPLAVSWSSTALLAPTVGELGIPGLLGNGPGAAPTLFTDRLNPDPGPAAGLGELLRPGQPTPGGGLIGALAPPAALSPELPSGATGTAAEAPAAEKPSDTAEPLR